MTTSCPSPVRGGGRTKAAPPPQPNCSEQGGLGDGAAPSIDSRTPEEAPMFQAAPQQGPGLPGGFIVNPDDLGVRSFVQRHLLRGRIRTLPAVRGRLVVYPTGVAASWPLAAP